MLTAYSRSHLSLTSALHPVHTSPLPHTSQSTHNPANTPHTEHTPHNTTHTPHTHTYTPHRTHPHNTTCTHHTHTHHTHTPPPHPHTQTHTQPPHATSVSQPHWTSCPLLEDTWPLEFPDVGCQGVEPHLTPPGFFCKHLGRKLPEMFAINEVCDLLISFFLSFNHPKRSLISHASALLGMRNNEARLLI